LTKDITIRQYQPGDEEEIVELLRLVFDGWPKFDVSLTRLDHWRWKYLDNNFKRNIIVLGEKDGRIVSVNHNFPVRIKIGEKVCLCCYAADTAVDPEYRRMGLTKKMYELNISMKNDAGIQFDYFVTSNPFLIKSFSKNYYSFPFPVLNLVRIKDIKKQLEAMPIKNAWLLKLGFYITRLLNDIRKIGNNSDPKKHDTRIIEIDRFDHRIHDFWDILSNQCDFIVGRRGDYINWRYCDPRAGNYFIKQAEDGEGRILGYSVLGINRYLEEYHIGYIIDLLTTPDRLDVADALTADAVRFFNDQKINIVNALVFKNHPHERILSRYGFLDSRIKLQLFLRKGVIEMNELDKLKTYSPGRMHFSYGDIDSLPVDVPGYR